MSYFPKTLGIRRDMLTLDRLMTKHLQTLIDLRDREDISLNDDLRHDIIWQIDENLLIHSWIERVLTSKLCPNVRSPTGGN